MKYLTENIPKKTTIRKYRNKNPYGKRGIPIKYISTCIYIYWNNTTVVAYIMIEFSSIHSAAHGTMREKWEKYRKWIYQFIKKILIIAKPLFRHLMFIVWIARLFKSRYTFFLDFTHIPQPVGHWNLSISLSISGYHNRYKTCTCKCKLEKKYLQKNSNSHIRNRYHFQFIGFFVFQLAYINT